MRKIAIALAAVAALSGAAVLEAKPKLTPQERLDKLLEGREAGKPINCISHWDTREMQVLDNTAIVYGWGNVIYVNRPTHPASLDDDDIMVTEPRAGQLCRLDTVRFHDRSGFWFSGFAGLQDFVPYRKVAARD